MPLSFQVDDPHALAFGIHPHLSPRTVIAYQEVLKDFFRWCSSKLALLEEVTSLHLRGYVAGMQARGLSSRTVSHRVIILKRFFGYLFAAGRLAIDPAQRLPVPKVGQRLPRALTLAETERLLSGIWPDSPLGGWDRLLMLLMYAGGCHPSIDSPDRSSTLCTTFRGGVG